MALSTSTDHHAATPEDASGDDHVIAPGNRAGVEMRGIEHIPDAERHGSARQVGLMWSGALLNVQVVVYGALLVEFGLAWWQAVAAILIGNLTWLVAGLCSLAGPAAGSTTFAINRAALGRNGNRPLAFFNWLMMIGYEVLDMVLMTFAVIALFGLAGVELGAGGTVAVVLVLAVVQSVLPVIGHAAITRVLRLLVLPFAALFVVLACLTAGRLSLPAVEPAGWPVFLGGVALAASGSGLGWSSSAADYSRYLPRSTSRGALVASVALGGAVPQTLLMLLGVGVALVAPAASDPIGGLPGAYPLWFVVPYLLLLIVQMMAVNAIDLYSSGVTLQAIGVRIGRWQAVVVDGVLSTAIAFAVVFSGDFSTILSNFLLFMIVWFAPWAAVFVVDYFLRRGRYDLGLLADAPARPGDRGFCTAGMVAQAAGMVAAACWLNTTVFTGPLSAATGGLDLSAPAGLAVGGVVYLLLAYRTVAPAQSA
ncbi:purine-cytosine permease family protein [Pseudonocardia alaniniphila]|uniref:Cytosine permease n=1 Tax=Pseudonocardia alaniniphila TaxID=75291 RepID=A0ABS9TRQ4_9PSEU|nr:cytosine permease [Pseudonocardia alaniniphila]MCH6171205.1 cytosine permease [Pseudonocardia alaniniphila]